jgi:hypothetical protein
LSKGDYSADCESILADDYHVEDIPDDWRCGDYCSGKGIYAHCIAIPSWEGVVGYPGFKGVCGNCRRRSVAATCSCGKIWIKKTGLSSPPPETDKRTACKSKSAEGMNLRKKIQ